MSIGVAGNKRGTILNRPGVRIKNVRQDRIPTIRAWASVAPVTNIDAYAITIRVTCSRSFACKWRASSNTASCSIGYIQLATSCVRVSSYKKRSDAIFVILRDRRITESECNELAFGLCSTRADSKQHRTLANPFTTSAISFGHGLTPLCRSNSRSGDSHTVADSRNRLGRKHRSPA